MGEHQWIGGSGLGKNIGDGYQQGGGRMECLTWRLGAVAATGHDKVQGSALGISE